MKNLIVSIAALILVLSQPLMAQTTNMDPFTRQSFVDSTQTKNYGSSISSVVPKIKRDPLMKKVHKSMMSYRRGEYEKRGIHAFETQGFIDSQPVRLYYVRVHGNKCLIITTDSIQVCVSHEGKILYAERPWGYGCKPDTAIPNSTIHFWKDCRPRHSITVAEADSVTTWVLKNFYKS